MKILLSAVLLLCLTGCGPEPKENLGFGETQTTKVARKSFNFARGQKMDYVAYSAGLGQWLASHEGKVHIDCIVPLDYGCEGTTTEFLIIYEEQ